MARTGKMFPVGCEVPSCNNSTVGGNTTCSLHHPINTPQTPDNEGEDMSDLEKLNEAATGGVWGQFSWDNGPWREEAKDFLASNRAQYFAHHDTSHHMSALVDGKPKRLAEWKHAADAAFAEALVNAYRAGELVEATP
jgi:hypothetical protein